MVGRLSIGRPTMTGLEGEGWVEMRLWDFGSARKGERLTIVDCPVTIVH